MRKLFLLGLLSFILLTSCTKDLIDNIVSHNIDEQYRFQSYEEFLDIRDKAIDDNEVFVVERSEMVDISKVDQLDLETIFEDIQVVESLGNEVVINYFVIVSEKSKDKLPEYDFDQSIKFHVDWNKLNASAYGMMLVEVPASFDGDVKIKSVSGDLNFENISGKDFKFETVSGDIDLGNSDHNDLVIKTVSGHVKTTGISSSNLDINTTSGDVSLAGILGEMDINTVSGDVEVTIDEVLGNLEVDTTSGDVQLDVNTANVHLDIKSVSGDIYSVFEVIASTDKDHRLIGQIGSAKYDIEIDTVSGDIDLRKK